MSDALVVDALEQLKPFLNDKKILEIVVRGKNKRIQAFQKIALNDLPQQEQKELAEKVVQALNKNALVNERNMNLIGSLLKSQKIGLLLGGANLCATCVGFAIMYAKLDKMSSEIAQQINQLQNVVKQGNDLHSGYEFNKILSDHTDMLDCRRKQQPYSEEKMRELVDQEYNVLNLLLEVFRMDISADHEKLIFSIFSLLSMFTVSLRFFDEIYYENNHSVLGDKNVWHSAHEKWMGVYTVMTSEWFIEKLQDYAMFETTLDTLGVDAYYINLRDQAFEQRQDVVDNQELILSVGDMEMLQALRKVTDADIKKTIEMTIQEVFGDSDNPEAASIFDKAFEQVGLA